MTVSTEVIKQGKIRFEPALPAEKIVAFKKEVLASYTKVFVKWEAKWWDVLNSRLHTMLIDEDDNTSWRFISEVCVNQQNDDSAESKMLCFTASGLEAKRVQELTDDEICREILNKLKKAFSKEIPEPTAIYVPRWDIDPLFLGAY